MSLQKKYLPVRLLSASVNSQSKPPASSRTKVFPMADETACFMVIDGMDGPVQVKKRPIDCFRIVKNSGEDNFAASVSGIARAILLRQRFIHVD
jgi:hypothetical protein